MIPQTQEQEALVQPELNLSLEARVILAFKHKTPNRYRLLDKLVRAYIDPDCKISDKRKYLSEKSKKLLVAILKKIFNGENPLLNHKYISKATRCKSDQNAKILKELGRILNIQYWDVFTNKNGQNFLRHYTFEINPLIVQELKDTGAWNLEFCPDFNRSLYNNKNISNRNIIRSRANFSNVKNSNSQNLGTEFGETKNLVAKESCVNSQANQQATESFETPQEPQPVETTIPKAATVTPIRTKAPRPSNKRRTRTKEEQKQLRAANVPTTKPTPKVVHNGFLSGGKRLSEIQPYLTDELCEKLRSSSGKLFTNKAIREITKAIAASERGRQAFFYHINGVVTYLTPAFAREKRDPNKVGSDSYYTLAGMTAEDKLLHEREKYLNQVENSGIHTRCDYTQYRARIAGQFPINLAYALLTNMVEVKKQEHVLKVTMHKLVPLGENHVQLLLKHAKGIGGYAGVNELEFVGMRNSSNFLSDLTQCYNSEPRSPVTYPKKQASLSASLPVGLPEEQQLLQLPKGIWGKVCDAFISEYGYELYKHWLESLSVEQTATTIELSTSSDMVRDRIEQNYMPFLSEVAQSTGINKIILI